MDQEGQRQGVLQILIGRKCLMDPEIPRLQVTPGLHHLNLSSAFTSYPPRIEKRKQQLTDAKTQENPIVSIVVELLRNSMYYHLPRRKSDIKHRYKELLRENPKHLNTLAELKFIHDEEQEWDKSEEISRTIRTILDSEKDDDIQRKCVCILEQAYAMLFEERTDTECSAYSKICDAYKIISGKEPELLQTEIFQNILECAAKTRKLALQIPVSADDGSLKIEACVQYFTQGIELLSNSNCPPHNITIWGFYLAMALNRYPEVIKDLSAIKKSEVISKAIELFWSTIRNLPDDTDEYVLYRARSYVYIGHIMAYNGRSMDNDNPEFQSLDERLAVQRAIDLLENDEVVLNRSGRIYLYLSKQQEYERERLEDLRKAEHFCSLSINLDPRIHNRTFTVRMRIYEEMSKLQTSLSREEQKKLLLKARSDGLCCMEGNLTAFSATRLALTCQKLAKFPNHYRFGPQYVAEREFLFEAIDYLNSSLRSNYTYRNGCFPLCMSSLLFDLGEIRGAIEWRKCALFQTIHVEKHLLNNFRDLCIYMFSYYANSRGNKKEDLLDELLSVFEEMHDMMGGNIHKIQGTLKKISREHISAMRSLFRLSLTKEQTDISMTLRSIIPYNRQIQNQAVSDHLQEDRNVGFEPKEQHEHCPVTDIVEITTPLSEDHSFDNDFFIVHSENEEKWLKHFLLYQLREKMHDDDIALQGHLIGGNVALTDTVGARIVQASNESRSIILVLTNEFLCGTLPKMRVAITQLLLKRPHCLIIVLLENCTVPPELGHISRVCLVDRETIPENIRNLKLMLIA